MSISRHSIRNATCRISIIWIIIIPDLSKVLWILPIVPSSVFKRIIDILNLMQPLNNMKKVDIIKILHRVHIQCVTFVVTGRVGNLGVVVEYAHQAAAVDLRGDGNASQLGEGGGEVDVEGVGRLVARRPISSASPIVRLVPRHFPGTAAHRRWSICRVSRFL